MNVKNNIQTTTENVQSNQLSINNNLPFKSVIEQALNKDTILSEVELARLAGFTEKEINMLKMFWQPCFNNSWLYLSDDIILEYLTNETGTNAIRNFNNRILTKFPYVKGTDYEEVTAEHELVKFHYSKLNNDLPARKPGNRKKYFIVTGSTFKYLLMSSRAVKGHEARLYYKKVESLAIIMKDYLFAQKEKERKQLEQEKLQIELKYKKLERIHNSSLQKHKYYKFKETGPCFYIIDSGLGYSDGLERIKIGIAGVQVRINSKEVEEEKRVKTISINKRLATHRTLWPHLRVNFLLFTRNVDVIEKNLKIVYKNQINPNGHEIIEGVNKEIIIQKTIETISFLNINEDEYCICSVDELQKYNENVATTIKKVPELCNEDSTDGYAEEKEDPASIRSEEEFEYIIETYDPMSVSSDTNKDDSTSGDVEGVEEYKDEGVEEEKEVSSSVDGCGEGGVSEEEGEENMKEFEDILNNINKYKDTELIGFMKKYRIPYNCLKEEKKKRIIKFIEEGGFKKVCNNCKKRKEINNYRKFGSLLWFSKDCKECEIKMNSREEVKVEKKKSDVKKGEKTKRCSKCKEDLSLNDFYKNKYQRDGYMHYCKRCETERKSGSKLVREMKKRPKDVPDGYKWCPKCEKVLSRSSYQNASNRADGLQHCCRDCYNEDRKKRDKLNRVLKSNES